MFVRPSHLTNLTRMQRLRTCAACRPDAVGYRDPVVATRLSLKYLDRRILNLNCYSACNLDLTISS